MLAVLLGMTGGGLAATMSAQAETVAFDLTGQWSSSPTEVLSGVDVLGAVWRFDINDGRPAPANDPVPNNLLTVSLQNGRFTKLPPACLTDSVDASGNLVSPVSVLSADRRVLTCNIGTRDQGTAQLALTGVLVDGPAGARVGASAVFRGLEATLPEIPIVAPFAMDAKFDGGAPAGGINAAVFRNEDLSFPFSVSHANGAPAGPASVTYVLTITNTGRPTPIPEVQVRGTGCIPQDRRQPGYPFSGEGHPVDQTAVFPTCTLVKVDATRFELTLSNLDYTEPAPSLDSNGQPLRAGMNVIAAGELTLAVDTFGGAASTQTSNVTLQAAVLTYTAVDGQTADDDQVNNSNSLPIVRGGWTHQWALNAQLPASFPGSPWQGTWRAPAGATVMSVAADRAPPSNLVNPFWMCTVIDTDHAVFEDARVVMRVGDAAYYDDAEDTYPVWYYTGDPVTGELVDPVSGDPVDPNLFACGGVTNRTDPAAGNPPGWSTIAPTDLSTVKAVKVQTTYEMGAVSEMPRGLIYFAVDQRIKPDVDKGQDIWTWTSFLHEGQSNWAWTPTRLAEQNRLDSVATNPFGPNNLTAARGYRYDYAGPGRDVLEVVGSSPLIEVDVLQKEYGPGTVADYQVRFGLETTMATPVADHVVVTSTLPPGLTYVPGSAATEPQDITAVGNVQTLTWTVENVMPNDPLGVINFKAAVPTDAELGSVLTTQATATSQTITRTASVQFLIPDSGYTTLAMTVDQPTVHLDADGDGLNSWTVTMTSQDPHVSPVTDTIVILPADADARGSRFSGSVVLSGPVQAPPGATVYYTIASTVNEDPQASVNGVLGIPSGIWSETFTPGATAIRVTGGPLAFDDTSSFTIDVELSDAAEGDVYVAGGAARATSTGLRMRTSAEFATEVTSEPGSPRVSIGDGVWLDANHNGIQDDGDDAGIEGVVLELTGPDGEVVTTDADGNPITGRTTTGPDGTYLFVDLAALPSGQGYTVSIIAGQDDRGGPLDGLVPTIPQAPGSTTASDSSTTRETSAADLSTDGAQDRTLDFGFWRPAPGGPGVDTGGESLTRASLGVFPVGVLAALIAATGGVALLLGRSRIPAPSRIHRGGPNP